MKFGQGTVIIETSIILPINCMSRIRIVRVTKGHENISLLTYHLNKYLSNQVIFVFVRLHVDIFLDQSWTKNWVGNYQEQHKDNTRVHII